MRVRCCLPGRADLEPVHWQPGARRAGPPAAVRARAATSPYARPWSTWLACAFPVETGTTRREDRVPKSAGALAAVGTCVRVCVRIAACMLVIVDQVETKQENRLVVARARNTMSKYEK